jgi:hypothetical protein
MADRVTDPCRPCGPGAHDVEQATPFNRKLVGAGLADPLPLYAGLHVAPGARFCAQSGAFAVKVGALKVQVPFQPLASDTPAGAVNVSVQLVNVVVPVFFSVTVALKPPDHELSAR